MKSWSPYALLVVAAIALDQWVKYLVETGLAFQEKLDLVPFLALYRTYNTGIAFSMFSSFGDTGLVVIAVLVVAFVLYLATRTPPGHVLARTGFALIIGGALGNLIDRLARGEGFLDGHVIDWVQVPNFPTFNVADSSISVAVAVLLIGAWRSTASAREPSNDDASV